MEVFDETQGETILAPLEPTNWDVNPIQTLSFPTIEGNALTVNVVPLSWQPLLSVKVIVVVPDEIPATKPELSIVATDIFEETHGDIVAGEFEIRLEVEPTQVLKTPEIVGNWLTLIATLPFCVCVTAGIEESVTLINW